MDPAPGPHSDTVSLPSKVTNRSSTVTLFVLFTHLSNLSFYCHSFTPVPCGSGQGRRFHIQNAPSRSRPFLRSHDPIRPMDRSHKCMLIPPAWPRLLAIHVLLGTESRGADKLPYRRTRTSSYRFSATWSLTSRSDSSSHKTSLLQGKTIYCPL